MFEGLSVPLLEAIDTRLARGEQSLLFLNRRGYAPVIACDSCGWLAGCPRCSAYLVLHRPERRLRCHHCMLEATVPHHCPDCGNVDIAPLGRTRVRIDAVDAQGDVFARSQPRHERRRLKHDGAVGAGIGHLRPFENDAAARNSVEPRRHRQNRRFAATRMANEGDELPLLHFQIEAVDDGERALWCRIGLADLVELLFGQPAHVLAVQHDLSRIGAQETDQVLDQHALADAGRADDEEALAIRDLEVDAPEHHLLAKRLVHVAVGDRHPGLSRER